MEQSVRVDDSYMLLVIMGGKSLEGPGVHSQVLSFYKRDNAERVRKELNQKAMCGGFVLVSVVPLYE